MKVLVIGGGGMLGHKLLQVLGDKFDLWTTFRTKFDHYESFGIFDKEKAFENVDIEDFKAVEKILFELKPDVIINAVGIVKQLPTAKNAVKTLTVNSIFPHQLAEAGERIGARLINISTDCVFSGKKGKYTESDVADAEDLYGKSKNLGEVADGNCLTLRTSIIGRELYTAHSLVEWFLSNEGQSVKGYTRAIFSGFPTLTLAGIIADVIEKRPHLCGLYHVSSEPINKFDLLELIKKAYRRRIEIEPFNEFEIDRSLNSEKFRKATGFESEPWEKMIAAMAWDDALYQNKR